jgi:hypothetical protein
MDRLEEALRDELTRRVAAPPYLPNLADSAVRRGRRVRQRRVLTAAGAALAVVAVALASTSVLPSSTERGERFADAPLEGPPRVPLFLDQSGELVDWVDGEQRAHGLPNATPVAKLPDGLLVVGGPGGQLGLGVLADDRSQTTPVLTALMHSSVAVSDDGARVAVVTAEGFGRQLQELELPSGRVLRSVALAQPWFPEDEFVLPVAYSGDAVLLTVGEGPRQRAMVWEGGGDAVVGQLDGFRGVAGGADADFSSDRDTIGGRAAFTVDDADCGVEVHQLRNGAGNPWKLCGEDFVGFSPGGGSVLAVDEPTALVVRDADNGDVRRTFETPDSVATAGWESEDALLYTSVRDGVTAVIRCSISRSACATAVDLPRTEGPVYTVRSVG